MKNSKLPWRKTPGNRPSHFQCADGYNIGSVNSGGTTEGEANLNLVVTAVNEHAALVAVAEAAKQHSATPGGRSDLIELALNNLAAVRAGNGGGK